MSPAPNPILPGPPRSGTVLTVPFHPDPESWLGELGLKPRSKAAADFQNMACEAETLASPRAVLQRFRVEESGRDTIRVDGVRFRSRILAVHLRPNSGLFAYVATAGSELDRWTRSQKRTARRLWAESLSERALSEALCAIQQTVDAQLDGKKSVELSPGSLPDWALSEQKALFRLLGSVEETVGVRLTDGFMMEPVKSASGVRFSTPEEFIKCSLCERSACRLRSAPYDKGLWQRRYAVKPSQECR